MPHRFTHLCFHIQACRSCVLPQIHCILRHLWTKTVLSKEGQGPSWAAAQAQPMCSRSRWEDSLRLWSVAVLHILRAVGACVFVVSPHQGTLSSQQKLRFRGAFIAAPRWMLSSLHDPCVRTATAYASTSKQERTVGERVGVERRGGKNSDCITWRQKNSKKNLSGFGKGKKTKRDPRVALWVFVWGVLTAQCIYCLTQLLKGKNLKPHVLFHDPFYL